MKRKKKEKIKKETQKIILFPPRIELGTFCV